MTKFTNTHGQFEKFLEISQATLHLKFPRISQTVREC